MTGKKTSKTRIFEGWDFLVVDDIQDNCDILRMILEFQGATVHVANEGMSAFKMAIKVHPKVILTDLSMPGIDGWQFIDMIQDDPRTSEAKIVAITALNWEDHFESRERPSFVNYLAKPIDPGKLIEVIQQLFPTEQWVVAS